MRFPLPIAALLLAPGCLINFKEYDENKARFDSGDTIDAGMPDGWTCDVVLDAEDQNSETPQTIGAVGRSAMEGVGFAVPYTVCGFQEHLGGANWLRYETPYDAIVRVRLEIAGDASFNVGLQDQGGAPDGIGNNGLSVIGTREVDLVYPARANKQMESWIWHWGTWPAGTTEYPSRFEWPDASELDSEGPPTWYKYVIMDAEPAPMVGSVIVDEVYPDERDGPTLVSNGWFELWNTTTEHVSLEYMTINGQPLVLGENQTSWDLQGHGYVVLGAPGAAGTNFVVDDESLRVGVPTPLSLSWRTTVIDSTMKDTGTFWEPPLPQHSLILRPGMATETANDLPGAWCSHGDTGEGVFASPGLPNSSVCDTFR